MADTSAILWLTVVWAVAGMLIAASVAFVLYSFVGVFLYHGLRPAHRWIEQRLDNPSVSATVTLLVVGIPMVAVLIYAGLHLVRDVFPNLLDTGTERIVTQED